MDRRGQGVQHEFGEVNKVHNTEEREKKELKSMNKRVEGDHGVTQDESRNKQTGFKIDNDEKRRADCNKGGCH
ncbi:unnamed protein product [Caenorhabditis brenneri]